VAGSNNQHKLTGEDLQRYDDNDMTQQRAPLDVQEEDKSKHWMVANWSRKIMGH
jgi:hypothetical protein